MIFRTIAVLSVFLLTGCVHAIAAPPDGEMITYETSPGYCFGPCPNIKLSVTSDGRATLRRSARSGFRFRAETSETRRFRVTPEQFAAFKAKLAPYKPSGERWYVEAPNCTDMDQHWGDFDIRWSGSAPPARLLFNYGCDREKRRAMATSLDHAPEALGLSNLPRVGPEVE